MDGRLVKLETQMTDVQTRMGRMETRLDKTDERLGKVDTSLATLIERVAHLPSKGFMVTSALGCISFITAVIVFADKIQAALGS